MDLCTQLGAADAPVLQQCPALNKSLITRYLLMEDTLCPKDSLAEKFGIREWD